MEPLLLGIDIGTSACKLALFTTEGALVAQGGGAYEVFYPQPGWAEQNPGDWWRSVCQGLQTMLAEGGINPARISSIGVDGQSWSAIPLDEQGEVLCNTPIWMDTRAAEICGELKEELEESLFRICGNPLEPSYTLPKILWYRRHKPELYSSIRYILQSNSYIGYRLTGAVTTDLSQGYGLHCFDMEKGQWEQSLCTRLGIDSRMLPPLVPSHQVIGRVTERAAAETGLCQGTPVVAGGVDAACGALGAGVIEGGETQEQGGQAGGMSICTDHCQSHRCLILGRHVVPGKWLLQGGTVGGGGAIRWFEKEFCHLEREEAGKKGVGVFAEMDREAESIAPGSDGLVFLPYMAGERSPIWDSQAKGVFYGVDFTKSRGRFIRAVMEGVAFSLRHNLETALEADADVRVLRAMGGAANSRLWTQIKADVTGKSIEVPASDTATTLGAAILAGVGVGTYASFQEAVNRTVSIRRVHTPDPEAHRQYGKAYGVYRSLYPALKNGL